MISRKAKIVETCFQEYGERLYNTACFLLGDSHAAEDLCQSAFCELYKSIDRFEGRSSVYTWLHRIMLNLYYKQLRKRAKERRLLESVPPPEVSGQSLPEPDSVVLKGTVREMVEALPTAHKSVIILKYFYELSYLQMAEVLDCPVGTIRSRLFHARQEMRRKLKERFPDEL